MKKILLFAWGLAFLIFFESCSKEKITPNNAKKTASSEQSVEQNPPPEQTTPTCPHAPCSPASGHCGG